MITKRVEPVEKSKQEDFLHCPVCMKRRLHSRRVSCGMVVLTCRSCGNVQSYVLRVEEVEE